MSTRTTTTMGLATAFDRLRGRSRRGFGKASSTDHVAADDDDVALETEEAPDPAVVVEEAEERLWSDPEDELVDEPSLQKTILANEEVSADSGSLTKATPELPFTTRNDDDPLLKNDGEAGEHETTAKETLVSDPEDIDNDIPHMEEADTEEPATQIDGASSKAGVTAMEERLDAENPKLDPGDEDFTETLLMDDNEEPKEDIVPSLESTSTTPQKEKNEINVNLDLEDVLASTEHWFAQVSDKQSVTVKDIVKSLCIEYDCSQLPTRIKKAVRKKLSDLINKETNESDNEIEDDEMFGDKDDSSADEGDSESSDDASSDRGGRRAAIRKRKKDIAKPSKTSTKLAKKVHAQQLKKRQLEAERVKNEELNALQSKQDEAVAEAIASALEIDQDTLPQRLELLSKLDAKRLDCFRELEPPAAQKTQEEPSVASPVAKATLAEDDSSSDEDMELEIEGPRQSLGLKLVAPFRSPPKPKAKPVKNDRAALRARLVQKQRTMGNQWLARELGYKDEQEHLVDCRAAETEKRKRIQQLEEAKANLRARQRERLLQGVQDEDEEQEEGQSRDVDENQDDENGDFDDQSAQDEDEELALAKEIEQEATDESDIVKDDDGVASAPVIENVGATFETGRMDVSRPETQMTNAPPVEDPGNSEARTDRDGNHVEPSPGMGNVEASTETNPDSEDDCQPETQMADSLSVPSGVVDTSDKKTSDLSAVIDKCKVSDEVAELHDFADIEDDEDNEAVDEQAGTISGDRSRKLPERKTPKNLGWKAILEKDKLVAKKKKNSSLVEEEADEEEEEQVAGLEDFGFVVKKKKVEGENEPDGEFNDDDLKDVVDDLSDNEGDEDAGEKARKVMEKKEEKFRHKEIMRRMREGYDGRRGGIAAGGASRGLHRFEDLVAADNREDAKRLGLLNDDELDSDEEEKDQDAEAKVDEEEDEAAFLDKIIKDRFLHRSSIQENFDEDDVEDEAGSKLESEDAAKERTQEEIEELEQERLAKRFSKRARMTRLVESHGDREEFSKSRLVDEDESIMADLQSMKNGLVRKRTSSSQGSSALGHLTSSIISTGGNLGMELSKSRRTKFARRSLSGGVTSSASIKSISFSHVVFQSSNSRSGLSNGDSNSGHKSRSRQPPMPRGKSFFERTVLSTLPSKKRKA